MGACPLPWFPIYAAEMLADTNFVGWTPAERGCWFTLISRCWVDESIPAEVDRLARLCGCNAKAMREHWKAIADRFIPHPTLPGRLISHRVELEREAAIKRAESMTERGRNAATRRWQKEKSKEDARALPKQCRNDAQSMPKNASFTLHPSPSPNTPLAPRGQGGPAGGPTPPAPVGGRKGSNPMALVAPELQAVLAGLLGAWDPAKAVPRAAAVALQAEVHQGDATGEEILACALRHLAAYPPERRQYLVRLPNWLAEGGYRVYLPALREARPAELSAARAGAQGEDSCWGVPRARWEEMSGEERDQAIAAYCEARGLTWAAEGEDDQVESTATIQPLRTAVPA